MEKVMKTWQLQDAKAHLSELVKNAFSGQPQEITLRGKPAVVVLSAQQYKKLKQPKQKLAAFLQQSPLVGIDLNIERDKSPMRDTAATAKVYELTLLTRNEKDFIHAPITIINPWKDY
jgi:prevent-host-death family protein